MYVVCMCTCICSMCEGCKCMCVHIGMDARVINGILLKYSPPYSLTINLEFIDLASLASPENLSNSPIFANSPSTEDMLPCLAFCMGVKNPNSGLHAFMSVAQTPYLLSISSASLLSYPYGYSAMLLGFCRDQEMWSFRTELSSK